MKVSDLKVGDILEDSADGSSFKILSINEAKYYTKKGFISITMRSIKASKDMLIFIYRLTSHIVDSVRVVKPESDIKITYIENTYHDTK